MAYTLGIDLDIDQVKLCLIHVEGPQKVPYVDWLIFRVPFHFGPDYYCEFGGALMETIAQFLYVKKIDPQQLNKIYFLSGMPYSAFASFEEGLHYTANVFIQSLFDPEKVGILRADGKPFTPREILASVKGESASAFVATQFYGSSYLASRMFKNAVVIDVGSRETHITPILKARIDPEGRAKLGRYLRHRLSHHQFMPHGALYTSVNQIRQSARLKDQEFPFTARVCRMVVIASLLKYIHPEIAREHDFPLLKESDAYVLLARAIGLDLKTITQKELHELAQVIYTDFCDYLGDSLQAVLKAQGRQSEQLQLVSSGVAGKHVMDHAFRRNQLVKERFVHFADKLPHRLHEASNAYGIALYAMERLMDENFPPEKVEVLP